MTREAFIRKWLANPQTQYNEQFRDEMRDDLDSVIEYSKLHQPTVISAVCSECGGKMVWNGLYEKTECESCGCDLAN